MSVYHRETTIITSSQKYDYKIYIFFKYNLYIFWVFCHIQKQKLN